MVLDFRRLFLVRCFLDVFRKIFKMDSKPDLYEKIRIKPRGSKQKEEAERAANECAWQDCEKPGAHKAPMGRNHAGHYLHFCLAHVRQYNKNFNYFSGLSDEQVAKFQKENITGNRPTWKMNPRRTKETGDLSSLRGTPAWHKNVRSRYDASGRRVSGDEGAGGASGRKVRPMEEKALRVLGLSARASAEEITRQYKLLVKRNHPDANGGDRSCEKRLQQILSAYKQLKKANLC